MTGIGSSTPGLATVAASRPSLGGWLGTKFDRQIESFLSFLTSVLCRASRGYLCPPDMTQVMYPDEALPEHARASAVQKRGCCNENISGK